MKIRVNVDENVVNMAAKAVETIEKMPSDEQENFNALSRMCIEAGMKAEAKIALAQVTVVGVTSCAIILLANYFSKKKLSKKK